MPGCGCGACSHSNPHSHVRLCLPGNTVLRAWKLADSRVGLPLHHSASSLCYVKVVYKATRFHCLGLSFVNVCNVVIVVVTQSLHIITSRLKSRSVRRIMARYEQMSELRGVIVLYSLYVHSHYVNMRCKCRCSRFTDNCAALHCEA